MTKKTVVLGALYASLLIASSLAGTPTLQSGFLRGGETSEMISGSLKDGSSSSLPAIASGSTSNSAGLIGAVGGYRFVFKQGSTVGVDVSANCLSGNVLGHEFRKRFNQTNPLFDNRLKREVNLVPSLSFGKLVYDQLHIALGLGLGIAQFKHRVDTIPASSSASSSQTSLGFVPSVGAEYNYTKQISFIGNVSYERYRNAGSNFGPNASPGASGSNYWSAIKPKFLTPKAGIIYRF
ncbi:MAG: hypothetical protein ACOH2E_05165 [Candidatus Paracaedibacter sp.]